MLDKLRYLSPNDRHLVANYIYHLQVERLYMLVDMFAIANIIAILILILI